MFYKPNNPDQSQTNFLPVLRIRLEFRLEDPDPAAWFDGWDLYNMFYNPNNLDF